MYLHFNVFSLAWLNTQVVVLWHGYHLCYVLEMVLPLVKFYLADCFDAELPLFIGGWLPFAEYVL